jgi:hypothetical protein
LGSSNLNPEIACRRSRPQGGSASRFSLFLSHVVTKNILNRKTPLLIAVLASAALSTHAQNLVTNPGFETGDFTGWTPVRCFNSEVFSMPGVSSCLDSSSSSLPSVRNPNFPRYIVPDFLQYVCERKNKPKIEPTRNQTYFCQFT